MGLLISGVSLFTRKTVFTFLAIIFVFGLVTIFSIFKIPLVVYFGLAYINDIIPYAYYPLTMLSIILPISVFGYGIYHFEKVDL